MGPPLVETPGRLDIALALPLRDGRVLVARRASASHLAGMWEFPGGKVEAGEEPLQAARRELLEETGLTAERFEPLTVLLHDYVDRPLRLHVYIAHEPSGEVRADPLRAFEWVRFSELRSLQMPEANAAVVRALRWRMPRDE